MRDNVIRHDARPSYATIRSNLGLRMFRLAISSGISMFTGTWIRITLG